VILDALRAGDADRAEAVMRAHVLGTAPLLANFVNSTNSGTGDPDVLQSARQASK
jgi:DNA-binding GntR family transcriptional regulator